MDEKAEVAEVAAMIEWLLDSHPELFPIARYQDPECGEVTMEDQLPGHLFDYAPGYSAPPRLRCVVHPNCGQEVVVSYPRLLADLAGLEKLVGLAKADGERERHRLGLCQECRDEGGGCGILVAGAGGSWLRWLLAPWGALNI